MFALHFVNVYLTNDYFMIMNAMLCVRTHRNNFVEPVGLEPTTILHRNIAQTIWATGRVTRTY